MRNVLIGLLTILTISLAACANDENNEVEANNQTVISETEAGDFILRLVSEKAVYEAGEEVTIVGKLKYIGEEEELTISHAESPFWFEFVEVTRGIEIPFSMLEIERETALVQNQWHEKEYQKQTMYNEEDNEADFLNVFMNEEGFPPGEYEVELRSEFIVKNGESKEEHSYMSSIVIEVN